MIGIALFGAGRIGQMHARLLADHPNAALLYVVDAAPARAAELAARHGAQAADAATALADPAVKAVLIATATDTHAGLIEQAAAAGKDIFCEKPIDLALERAAQAVAAAQAAGVRLVIGLNRHFDPGLLKIKDLLDEGAIGTPIQLVIHNGDKSAPAAEFLRSSGFIVRDMMIHDIDVACWLLGREVEGVFAAGAALVDPEIGAIGDADTGSLTLLMQGGVLALLTVTRFAAFGFDARLEVRGTKGALWLQNPGLGLPVLRLLTAAGIEDIALPALQGQALATGFDGRFAAAFAAQTDGFIRLLAGEAVTLPGAAEAMRAMQVADAAAKILERGNAGFEKTEK